MEKINNLNPKVDFYFTKNKTWQKEIEALRVIALSTHLTEELKWGCPCYTLNGGNIFLIHVFKEYCAILFIKGSLLKDPKKILIQQTKYVQAARQIRFTHTDEITKLKPVIKAYMKEAIEIEKAGLTVKFKKNPTPVSEEFQKVLDTNAALKTAFAALTPGRQRAYIIYFSSAKQAKTHEARIEKCTDLILDGLGLDD